MLKIVSLSTSVSPYDPSVCQVIHHCNQFINQCVSISIRVSFHPSAYPAPCQHHYACESFVNIPWLGHTLTTIKIHQKSLRFALLLLCEMIWSHYSDIIWVLRQLNSAAIQLFGQSTKSKHQSSALLTLCEENRPVTGGFPTQRANNAESISISLHDHGCLTGSCPAQWANNLEMDVMKYLIRYLEWFIRVWVTMVAVSIMLGCSAKSMNTGLMRYLWQGLGREENSMGTLFSISVLSS